ncbi:MAG TPA: uroporphyrinogen-III synthase [Candidatus Binatia bacterium]|nr:uroporphyrinogen-III synthase [Candidatus Binatia bacterium]
MDTSSRTSLQGLKVVSFESRRSKEMAELIRRYGGEPIVAPSMREVPLSENHAALQLLPELEAGKVDLLILMTGVGTRTLNEVLLTRYYQERIIAALHRVRLIARGPKPVAVLKELGLEPAAAVPEPNTWREVLSILDSGGDLQGKRIAIQEYGIPNRDLVLGLETRGATVVSIPIYRWAFPEDLAPLRQAIKRILEGQADLALFTNATQVEHLFRIAAEDKVSDWLQRAFGRIVVGSVGPICTELLEQFGVKPDFEPVHPKMGVLVAEAAAAAHRLLAEKNAP